MTKRKMPDIGAKFNRLTVVGEGSPYICSRGKRNWRIRVKCECGTIKDVAPSDLYLAKVQSCGCFFRERQAALRTTHGKSHTAEFKSWCHLRDRCTNPNNKKYKDYGGRGIAVCDRWRDSFQNFYADMGPKPSSRHSIDRINVNGNYEPSNCRWATAKEQANNKRV